jgi:hypothetical protein
MVCCCRIAPILELAAGYLANLAGSEVGNPPSQQKNTVIAHSICPAVLFWRCQFLLRFLNFYLATISFVVACRVNFSFWHPGKNGLR